MLLMLKLNLGYVFAVVFFCYFGLACDKLGDNTSGSSGNDSSHSSGAATGSSDDGPDSETGEVDPTPSSVAMRLQWTLPVEARGPCTMASDERSHIYIACSDAEEYGQKPASLRKISAQGESIWARELPFSHPKQLVFHSEGLAVLGNGSNTSASIVLIDPNSGITKWKQVWNGDGERFGFGQLTFMPDGGISILGGLKGSLVVGNESYESSGFYADMLLIRLDTNGAVLNSLHIPQDGIDAANPIGILSLDNGNIVIHGGFSGSVVFGKDELHSTIIDAGDHFPPGNDIFVIELDGTFQHLWTGHYGNGYMSPIALLSHLEGDYVLVGSFSNELRFGGLNLRTQVRDLYLTKFNERHELLWSTQLGATNRNYIRSATMNSAGDLTIAGQFYETIEFPDNFYEVMGDQESPDGLLVHYTSNGEFAWSFAFHHQNFATMTDGISMADGGAVVLSHFDVPSMKGAVADNKTLVRKIELVKLEAISSR